MEPIRLARAMRRYGWRYHRDKRGTAAFGIRFPNGFGVTRKVNVPMLRHLQMTPSALAEFLTRDAAITAKYDVRG